MSANTRTPLLPTKAVQIIDHAAAGAEMRSKREKAKLSLRSIATKLGVSPAYLSDLELGRRAWTEERAQAFLAALK